MVIYNAENKLLPTRVKPIYVKHQTEQFRHNNHNTMKNVLKYGVNVSSIDNMDPHFAAGSQERTLADMIFNGLLRYQPGEAPKIEPDLASEMPEFEIIN